MELVTWNLNGLDERAEGPRLEAALQEILLGARLERLSEQTPPRSPPHVILLQEVTHRSFHAHLKAHLRAAGFTALPAELPERNHFELLAVRKPLEVLAYRAEPLWKTQFGRWLHHLKVRDPELGPVDVFTAHFDSGPERPTSAARRAQLRDVASRMAARAIFAGDTNLREEEWQAEAERLEIVDAYRALGSPRGLARTWRKGQIGGRFDRVWCSPDLEPSGLEGLGTTPVPGLGEPPSDHIGLRLRFGVVS